jgi:hypothetical protein
MTVQNYCFPLTKLVLSCYFVAFCGASLTRLRRFGIRGATLGLTPTLPASPSTKTTRMRMGDSRCGVPLAVTPLGLELFLAYLTYRCPLSLWLLRLAGRGCLKSSEPASS